MSRLLVAEKIKLIHSKKLLFILILCLLTPLLEGINSFFLVENGNTLEIATDVVVNGATGILMAKKIVLFSSLFLQSLLVFQ